MQDATTFDSLFRQAVLAVDSGDEDHLKQLLNTHPELAIQRLHAPGEWLTTMIANALDSFFNIPISCGLSQRTLRETTVFLQTFQT